jgi:hypothetical protein
LLHLACRIYADEVMIPAPDNEDIASVLDQVAALLEAQDGDIYRVRAYRNAADAVRSEQRSIAALLEQGGRKALIALPTIGRSIAASIDEFVHTGRLGLLERLEGQVSPEDLFTTLPGIGENLAHRIHDELHIETLEALEQAAHDGRLGTVPGFGPRRVRAVRDVLAAQLGRSARRRARRVRAGETRTPTDRPALSTLLEIDAAYRRGAREGTLRTIAPRRFNPDGRSWLPVLHAERDGWSFTAMFSNTARAHRLGTTRDWVVIYYEHDGEEDQCTVVTEAAGPHAGRRVVRGRENESAPAA